MPDFLTDIKTTATLARLQINETQAQTLIPQLKNILDMANEINSVNTDQTEALAHPLGFEQPLRKDEVTAVNQRELFQQNAPAIDEGLYIVPKIIEEE